MLNLRSLSQRGMAAKFGVPVNFVKKVKIL